MSYQLKRGDVFAPNKSKQNLEASTAEAEAEILQQCKKAWKGENIIAI